MANFPITFPRRLQRAFLVLFVMVSANASQARENAYDVLGKALVPLVKALIATPDMQSHAVSATLVLDSATNLPAADTGDTLDLALQSPDKLRLRATIAGQQFIVCRNGNDVWASPGAFIQALIDAQKLPKPDPDYKLMVFNLPIKEKQLVWLPLLFQATDKRDDTVDGANCMVLDVFLMPDLARATKVANYAARLWVRPDYRIAKIELRKAGGDWRALILVKNGQFASTLPPETWKPSQTEAADVMQLTPVRYKQLLDFISGQWASWKGEK
jgi:hypothetical protein